MTSDIQTDELPNQRIDQSPPSGDSPGAAGGAGEAGAGRSQGENSREGLGSGQGDAAVRRDRGAADQDPDERRT